MCAVTSAARLFSPQPLARLHQETYHHNADGYTQPTLRIGCFYVILSPFSLFGYTPDYTTSDIITNRCSLKGGVK